MADFDKAEKLAAARRRLEDFQKSKKKIESPLHSTDPVSAGQIFGHSPIEPHTKKFPNIPEDNGSMSPVAGFNTPSGLQHLGGGSFYSPPQNAQTDVHLFRQSIETTETEHKVKPPDSGGDSAFTPRIFNANAFMDSSKPAWDTNEWIQPKIGNDQKNISDFPPIQQEHLPSRPENELPKLSSQYSVNHAYGEQEPTQNGEGPTDITQTSQSVEPDVSSLLTNRENANRSMGSDNTHQDPYNGRSNLESLRILADQMTELCDNGNSADFSQRSASVAALESRIQDLNAQLAAERSNNQQLQIYMKESQARCVQLETKVAELRTEGELTLAQRIGPLQEQLRAHAQTVGILVGEKTELEAALAHHIATAEQRTGEMEELQSRLRASRHKVNELEKELSAATTKTQTNERQMQIYSQEQDRLKRENSVLSKQLEDVKEEASELRQKFNAKATEVANLENLLEEQQKQLSLAQLRVTQLSGVDSPLMTSELEALHQHKFSLEKRCSELTETLRMMGVERDQAAEQYQQYVTQLNSQLQSLNQKMDQLVTENGSLRKREQELVHAMCELERQLQQSRKVQLVESEHHPSPQSAVDAKDNSELEAQIETLKLENAELVKNLETKDQNVAELQAEIEECKAHISDLETLKGDQPDQSRLLAAMESDKVAAAQATLQNAKLKDQVQELQEAFIKISNDKLQLTENVENEKRVNSNMGEKIASLAEELHELRLLVAQRDRELQEYRDEHDHSHDHDHSRDHSRDHSHDHEHDHCHKSGPNDHDHHSHDEEHHHHHHHHTSDHYHSHESSIKPFSDGIEPENDTAQRPINDITDAANSNASLRCLLPQKSTESHESGSSSSVTEGATTDDGATDVHSRGCLGSHGMHNNYLSLQRAMEQLQARFTRTMTEYAELSDEKQKLEHLVMQLQGETETIGEYVALYQIQRAALQQRAREKDHQLACLSEERQSLRKKLADLSNLVCRLVEEKTLLNKENINLSDSLEHTGENSEEETTDNVVSSENEPAVEGEANNTAGQILALLSEIGTSSLVDNKKPENFHPCPWCSGRLITV